jgi:iron complex outermembrane receptor protein
VRFAGDPAGTCAGGMPMHTESDTFGAALRADFLLSQETLLRAGVELQRYRLDDWWPPSGGGMGPGTFWNIRDGERDRLAAYGEWESRIDSNWLASVGARFERVESAAGAVQGYSTAPGAPGGQSLDSLAFNARDRDSADGNWDFTALSRYTPRQELELEFGYSRKVRSPSLYERYPWSTWAMAAAMNNFVGDGNGYVGNPDLDPEQADTLSASLRWHDAGADWELRLSPFYTRVDDFIDAVPVGAFTPSRFNILRYANQSARLRGLDLSGRRLLARSRAGEFAVDAMASYTDGRNRDTGADLYQIMPVNGRIRLTHRLGAWESGLELALSGGKDGGSEVRNEVETGSFHLVNLTTSYSWRQLRLDVGVENLFDEYYELPLGGAYVGHGMTMSLNGIPWGVAMPGRGRSLNLAVTASF